jgi:ribosomal protein RSM22 (predicted rRNA methylase)
MTLEKDNLVQIFKSNQRAFGPFVLSVEDIKPYLLNPEISDAAIVKLVKEMSLKFTQKREHIEDYVMSEDLVSAYTALYLPTNIPKLHFLLSKLPEDVLEDFKKRPFIDIGSGPGTFSLGYKLLMGSDFTGECFAVDSSDVMLKQSRSLMNGFFPDDHFVATKKFKEQNKESILFFGHSINEMGINRAMDFITTIDPEYLIWIEPGTSDLFSELKKLRANILDGYDVLYPCPSNAACPSSWCHQVLRTSHASSVERISQLVSLDRKILPMTAHVYRKKKALAETHLPTLIRYINETKFSFEYEACFLADDKNKTAVIEIQKRDLTKEEEKMFKNSDVGEKVDYEVLKKIGEKLRIKLR